MIIAMTRLRLTMVVEIYEIAVEEKFDVWVKRKVKVMMEWRSMYRWRICRCLGCQAVEMGDVRAVEVTIWEQSGQRQRTNRESEREKQSKS